MKKKYKPFDQNNQMLPIGGRKSNGTPNEDLAKEPIYFVPNGKQSKHLNQDRLKAKLEELQKNSPISIWNAYNDTKG